MNLLPTAIATLLGLLLAVVWVSDVIDSRGKQGLPKTTDWDDGNSVEE